MTAKEYLGQALRARRQIEALAQRSGRCREMAGWRTGAGPELDALVRELDGRIEGYAALVRDIEGRIDRLESAQYRDVLKYRYLNGWSWRAIAARTGWSRNWLMKLHARALEAVGAVEGAGRGTPC